LQRSGYTWGMPSQDDDDWVGEPPEGRYTRDRAKPAFWAAQRTPWLIYGGVALVLLVALVLVIVLR
jgi:hypothetical protein